MIVLDTDLLTLVQRAEGEAYTQLVKRLDSVPDEEVGVTIVTFEEQMRGWLAWIAKARIPHRQVQAYTRLHALLEDFQTRPVLDFAAEAAATVQELGRLKTKVGTMDLKIAAICLVHDALLLSRNLRHFRQVPGLKVEDWTMREGKEP